MNRVIQTKSVFVWGPHLACVSTTEQGDTNYDGDHWIALKPVGVQMFLLLRVCGLPTMLVGNRTWSKTTQIHRFECLTSRKIIRKTKTNQKLQGGVPFISWFSFTRLVSLIYFDQL